MSHLVRVKIEGQEDRLIPVRLGDSYSDDEDDTSLQGSNPDAMTLPGGWGFEEEPFADFNQEMARIEHDLHQMETHLSDPEHTTDNAQHHSPHVVTSSQNGILHVTPYVGGAVAHTPASYTSSSYPSSSSSSAPVPVIRHSNGFQYMELALPVPGFGADEVHVIAEGNILKISARRQNVKRERTTDARVFEEARRGFKREFALPDVVRAHNLRCHVSPEGILHVEGPLGKDIYSTMEKKKRKVKFDLNTK